jgi:hypothetical protein
MSLRTLWLVAVVSVVACGGPDRRTVEAGEPQTAREKQYAEAKKAGDLDDGDSKWGKWRYTGDRKACFFVAGRKCFKTENAACQASKCKAPMKCKSSGAGPATVSCAK